jgi:hypothetical protein
MPILTVDYILGTSEYKSAATRESFPLIVEARKEWFDRAIPQVLCKAGCLLKRRLAAGKDTPVFAVLTNGEFFRFFAIDTDNVVYVSGFACKVLEKTALTIPVVLCGKSSVSVLGS